METNIIKGESQILQPCSDTTCKTNKGSLRFIILTIKHNRALTLIHERSCEYAFFKFVILCAFQSITVFQSIFLFFFLFSHVLDGLLLKEPYGQR